MEDKFLAPICPWSSFKFGKVLSCEERLCSWIRQPLNTASSLPFLLAAAYLLYRYRKERRLSDLVFGLSLIVIGLASILNHASQIKIFVSLDFSAIFVLICALFVLSLRRLGWLESKVLSVVLFVLLLSLTASLQYFYVRYGIPLVGLLVAVVIAMEFFPGEGNRKSKRGYLGTGLLVLGAGSYCFYLDVWSGLCDPTNHYFQFHSLWHLACAIGLLFLAAHHRQFYPARNGTPE